EEVIMVTDFVSSRPRMTISITFVAMP
ncbi:hypothetical protein CP061683_0824, partial [Chlamydia psittaci 06-1683]